jgi:hypothetical protein
MSTIAEISNIFDTLSEFFNSSQEYLLSGGVPPEVSTLFNLGYDALLTKVVGNSVNNGSFQSGANQEAIFTSAALSREISMSKMTKSQLYIGHAAELSEETTFYSNSGSFLVGVDSGNPTGGDR